MQKLSLSIIRNVVYNHGMPWSKGDKDYLRRHLAKGRLIKDIAADMGRSINSLLFAIDYGYELTEEQMQQQIQSVQSFRHHVNESLTH